MCYSPFRKEGTTIDLPCGKCYECRTKRISGWSFRLMKEAEVSSSAFFVTLTYSPETVPLTDKKLMTLNKRDVQLFLKRLRKSHDKETRIKYYAAGEYGGETWRPHYHLIMFNIDQEKVQTAWKAGNIHIDPVNKATVRYTLKYMAKAGKVPQFKDDDRLPEFSLMSKGLGSSYLKPNMIQWHKNDLLNRCYVRTPEGMHISMPRYYREKIYTMGEFNEIKLRLAEIQHEKESKLTYTEWKDQQVNVEKYHRRLYEKQQKDERFTKL